MIKKLLSLLVFTILTSSLLHAQITSSSISGVVTDNKNQPLVGASISATHLDRIRHALGFSILAKPRPVGTILGPIVLT